MRCYSNCVLVNEALIHRAVTTSVFGSYDSLSLKSVYNSLWGFRGNEAFFKRIKRFMVGYGFLYTALIFLSVIFGSAAGHPSLYRLALARIVFTTFLILIT